MRSNNSAADILPRYGLESKDSFDKDNAVKYFNGKLYSVRVSNINSNYYLLIAKLYLHKADYNGDNLILERCYEGWTIRQNSNLDSYTKNLTYF